MYPPEIREQEKNNKVSGVWLRLNWGVQLSHQHVQWLQNEPYTKHLQHCVSRKFSQNMTNWAYLVIRVIHLNYNFS